MFENFVSRFFEIDHDRLDIIYDSFKKLLVADNANAESHFALFSNGLLKHIDWEEQLLFPLFELRSGMTQGGPTFVMRQEHGMIKQLLNDIHEKLNDTDSALTLCFQLEQILASHNKKEEHILYPAIDNLMSESDIQDLAIQLNN